MELIDKKIIELGSRIKELGINNFICWEEIIPLNKRMGKYKNFYGVVSSVHIFSGTYCPIPHIIVSMESRSKMYFIGDSPYGIDNIKKFSADDKLTELVFAFLEEDVIGGKLAKIEKTKSNNVEKDFDILLNRANEIIKQNGVNHIVAEIVKGKRASISLYDSTYNDKAYGYCGRINISADAFNIYYYSYSAPLCGTSNSTEFTMDNIDFIESGLKFLGII